jgi:hypothetical protein
MEHTHSTTGDRPVRIPRLVWIIGGGLLIAFVAVVVFNVPFNTVASIGLIALMMGSHFFMHGGHGDHSQHNNAPTSAVNTDGTSTTDSTATVTPSTDQLTRHSGGRH